MIRLVPALLLIFLVSCDPPVQEQYVPREDPYKEQFVRTNMYMQKRHQDQIAAFTERVAWEAERSPSGLWTVTEEEGQGPLIADNDVVSFVFSSSLLDGTPCYEAKPEKPKQIIVGKGGVESGVNEGLKNLKNGSRAIFLIPPHLAHGNFGDRNKVPGNSVLIYRIEVLNVRPGS